MDTLLVIDDTPEHVKILLDFLSSQNFKVLIAHDGKDGIETAEFAQPDLILLDVLMPGLNGFEVCNLLKSKTETKDIPIIFMTVQTELVEKVKGFELGATDYITKPFEHEEVLARITTQLKLHKLQRQLSYQNQQLQAEIKLRQQAESSLQTERNSLAERTTELTMANAKLARAAKLKDEFLANMSHELRTPLNAILGISEAFQEQIYGSINKKQRKFIQTLEDSGYHLLNLIDDILDLSKIEANNLTLQIDIVSVAELCQASLHTIKDASHKKQIGVTTIIDYAIEMIQVDKRRVKQILVNLLMNAIKFTPNGGSIILEVNGDFENDVINFSVQDTGIGIPEQDMKYLFEKFVQLDGGLNRAQNGAGLGLSLVYRLTELHGGSVSVASEVGKGSCFTASLPLQLVPEKSSIFQIKPVKKALEKTASTDNHLPSGIILLADDQEATIEILFDYLTVQGYQVIIARNGVEAIEYARTKHPNLILMDIQMPVKTGLEAIQEIRADQKTATIPIIALTALAMRGDREHCLKAGANEYLSKPVNMKKLLSTMKTLL